MTFEETNAVVRSVANYDQSGRTMFYATCRAGCCTWVGEWRTTEAAAKRDAVRHHESDR